MPWFPALLIAAPASLRMLQEKREWPVVLRCNRVVKLHAGRHSRPGCMSRLPARRATSPIGAPVPPCAMIPQRRKAATGSFGTATSRPPASTSGPRGPTSRQCGALGSAESPTPALQTIPPRQNAATGSFAAARSAPADSDVGAARRDVAPIWCNVILREPDARLETGGTGSKKPRRRGSSARCRRSPP